METEIIETVLTEILDELKQLRKLTANNTTSVTENANRLTTIETKMESKPVTKPEINTQPVEQLLLSGLQRINKTLDEKPAPIRREFRILLFPEYNTQEYYRIVFGRLIFGW